MAPEQWTGAPASPAADVYAATATFFECLTRRKPYQGENFAELALRHLQPHIGRGERVGGARTTENHVITVHSGPPQPSRVC
jgi:serine/threonine protein kinase